MRLNNQTANQKNLARQNDDDEEPKLTVLRMENVGKSMKDDTASNSEENPLIYQQMKDRNEWKMKLNKIEDGHYIVPFH